MFGYNADAIVTPCEPGVVRRVLSWSDEMMMCEISFEKGAKGNFHHHPHEQITYVAEGSFSFTIDGETKTVNKGDSVYMPPNAEHGVTCLEAGKLVDVFHPQREDFLRK